MQLYYNKTAEGVKIYHAYYSASPPPRDANLKYVFGGLIFIFRTQLDY